MKERTYDWNGKTLPISRPDLTDDAVAQGIRMLGRNDLQHELWCVVARDRIMALVKELAAATAELEQLRRQPDRQRDNPSRMTPEEAAVLHDADPNCEHVHDPYHLDGIKCGKCGGWHCT